MNPNNRFLFYFSSLKDCIDSFLMDVQMPSVLFSRSGGSLIIQNATKDQATKIPPMIDHDNFGSKFFINWSKMLIERRSPAILAM